MPTVDHDGSPDTVERSWQRARAANAQHFEDVWSRGSPVLERFRLNLAAARRSFRHAVRVAGVPLSDVRVLDVGFGSGVLLFQFKKTCRLAGTEFSDAAIARATRRASEKGYRAYEFVKADGPGLPFPDGSFDVVVASHVVEHVADDIALMQEMRRVAASGGFVVILVPLDSTAPGVLDEAGLMNPAHAAAGHFHVRNYNFESVASRVAAHCGPLVYAQAEFETWDWKASLDRTRGNLSGAPAGRIVDRLIAALVNVPLAALPWAGLRALDRMFARLGYRPRQAAMVARRS